MKIVIGSTTYTEIFDIKFSPEATVLMDSLPVNTFEAKIKTDDTISLGLVATLQDDAGNVYARFRISNIKYPEPGTVEITATDIMEQLDSVTLPAKYYDTNYDFVIAMQEFITTVNNTLGTTFTFGIAQGPYPAVLGYVPEQTARERLQYLCFASGYYARTTYTTYDCIVEKTPSINANPTYIEGENVLWRPQYGDQDYATQIQLHYFDLTRVAPATIEATDNYVEVEDLGDTTYYLYFTFQFVFQNPLVPQGVPVHTVEIEDNMLINANNVSDVMAKCVLFYAYGGLELEAEIVEPSAAPMIGSYVSISTGRGREILRGYVVAHNYTFGKKNKIKIKIQVVDAETGCYLTIAHYGTNQQDDVYLFPEGYTYSINMKNIDESWGDTRVISTPLEDPVITGTMGSSDASETVHYENDLWIDRNKMQIDGVQSATLEDDVLSISKGSAGGSQPTGYTDDPIEYEELSLSIENGIMTVTGVDDATEELEVLEIE